MAYGNYESGGKIEGTRELGMLFDFIHPSKFRRYLTLSGNDPAYEDKFLSYLKNDFGYEGDKFELREAASDYLKIDSTLIGNLSQDEITDPNTDVGARFIRATQGYGAHGDKDYWASGNAELIGTDIASILNPGLNERLLAEEETSYLTKDPSILDIVQQVGHDTDPYMGGVGTFGRWGEDKSSAIARVAQDMTEDYHAELLNQDIFTYDISDENEADTGGIMNWLQNLVR